MGVNIITIVYLRVLIIEIGSTIVLMVVEAQGYHFQDVQARSTCRCGGNRASSKLDSKH